MYSRDIVCTRFITWNGMKIVLYDTPAAPCKLLTRDLLGRAARALATMASRPPVIQDGRKTDVA